jgi:ankyrin repeat protein
MTTPRLPERPNLEQLKHQAKDLLRSARAGDAGALDRFRTLPAFARVRDDDAISTSAALHDAQSVIARELGFPSWKALLERVEELTLDFGAAVDQFVEAATEVRPDRAERLLRLHPGIATANFYTALVLGDVERVEAHLAARPALATESGGVRSWPALLYLCHTSLRFGPATRRDGLVAVARRLLERGADPDTRFPWLHHGVRRAALWGAVCVARLLPLAEALLAAGADPNDGVTLPLAASGGDIESLELLRAHGADVNQRWATDGSATLYAILNWADTWTGVRWLLDHGADPDPVFAVNGETPLHVVARRGPADVAEELVHRGADVTRSRADGRTAYAVAELSANRAVAEWLERNGGATELSEVDRFVSACSRGDRATADAMVHARPSLRDEIAPEHYGALYRAAERNDTRALGAMLACGFDPNRGDDEIGKTALHAAAHEGRADAVRVLLSHGASVSVRDREFRAQPLVWAADGARSHGHNGRDYRTVGRLLLDAGSPVEWQPGDEPSQEIFEVIAEWRRSGEAVTSA